MPTTEERLAALETKLAALTDTTPTNYYTHQYSGEEIDAAVGRAVTGGALDTSVTNVSNQLGTFVRPNLLDNWYFGRPVDQRGGYIVLQGAMTYGDVACTQAHGPVSQTALPVYMVSNQVYAIDSIYSDDGSTYYVKAADVVRGYIPAWNRYSIDRWSVEADSEIVITLVNGGIRVKNTSTVARQFKQILPVDLNIAGKMITISALVGDVIGTVNYLLTQVNDPYKNSAACTITTNGLFSASGSVLTGQQKIVFGLEPGAEITILAAKLEIGPTQTLAHREGDRCVINEVPEYGEQLRRCQWYSNVLPGIYWLPQNADGTNRLTIPIPDMRTIPAVTYEPADGSTGTLYYDANLAQKNAIQFYATGVTGICGVKNIRISADL